ncbi:unnamed protein product [Ectocarpus sp. 6 AP-2014]
MLTTARVGLVAEDASMAQARPHLSEVNKRGLVTIDSQMGAKKEISHHADGGVLNPPVTHWQRSYIIGILAKDLGRKFQQKMRLVDGVDFFIGLHGPSRDPSLIHYINVTMYQQGDDEPTFFSNAPMATHSLSYSFGNLLPDVQHVMQSDTCTKMVGDDALCVVIVDLVWGRPFWLFEKVKEVLDEVIAEQT